MVISCIGVKSSPGVMVEWTAFTKSRVTETMSPACDRIRKCRASPYRNLSLVWLALLIGLSACGLYNAPVPATLDTRPPATNTPLPTPTSARNLPDNATSAHPVNPQVSALLDKVQSDRLMQTVSTLADMRTRHVLSPPAATTEISTARDWLVGQFAAIHDANPTRPIDVWTLPVPMTFNGVSLTAQNVVAVFQGTDIGGGVVVVGAHYDSVAADFFNGSAYAPGADDNGSGVAALLEIARIVAPMPHRATIMFAAFTAEETGRQGSLAFVNGYLRAQNPPIDVRGMINLDTIGSDTGPNGQVDPHAIRVFSDVPNESPSRQLARQFALFVTTYLGNATMVIESAEERVGRWGDQQSFSAAGYPSLHMIEGLENSAHEHSALDTVDNVQPDYLMLTTRAALIGVILLADGPLPPADVARRTSPEGDLLVWTPVPGASGYVIALRMANSLDYDQVMAVQNATQITWDGLTKYTYAAVGAVDADGRMGPLSSELNMTK